MAHQQLWLLRHGEAVPHGSKPDHDRELTATGERQARAAGAALARLGLEIAACYTSPLLRGRETAKLACDALSAAPDEREALSKEFDVDVVHDLLAGHADGARVLVVGHNPSFAQVVHDLTGARVALEKGGVAAVRVGDGQGELLALLRPHELESLVGDAS